MRAALICVALVAAAGTARAQSSVTERADEIRAEYDAGRFTAAFELSREAIAEYPTDPDVAYLHAWGLSIRNLNTEAIEVCRRALVDGAAGQSELLATIASNYSALGKFEDALKNASRALELDPTNAEALRVKAEAEQEERIRAGDKLALAPGSEAAFVDRFLTRVESGDVSGAVTDQFDPRVIDQVFRAVGLHGGSRDDIVRGMTDGMKRAWRTQYGRAGNHYVGFEVDPEGSLLSLPKGTGGAGGAMTVTAYVVQERRFTDQEVARLEKLVGSPELRQYADADMVGVIDSLDPSEHHDYFIGLAAVVRSFLLELSFDVVKGDDGKWVITDLLFGVPPVSVTTFARDFGTFVDKGLVDPPSTPGSPDTAYETGKIVGQLLAMIGILALIVWLLRRGRS